MPMGKSCLNCKKRIHGNCSGIPLIDLGYAACRRFEYI